MYRAAFNRPKILPFDNVFPSPASQLETPPKTAILYASLESSNFRDLHSFLFTESSRSQPRLEYVLRHLPKKTENGNRNHLTGYSVALDLKKTDYLAVDDRFQQKSTTESSQDAEPVEVLDPISLLIRNFPENATAPDAGIPLSEEEIESTCFWISYLILWLMGK